MAANFDLTWIRLDILERVFSRMRTFFQIELGSSADRLLHQKIAPTLHRLIDERLSNQPVSQIELACVMDRRDLWVSVPEYSGIMVWELTTGKRVELSSAPVESRTFDLYHAVAAAAADVFEELPK